MVLVGCFGISKILSPMITLFKWFIISFLFPPLLCIQYKFVQYVNVAVPWLDMTIEMDGALNVGCNHGHHWKCMTDLVFLHLPKTPLPKKTYCKCIPHEFPMHLQSQHWHFLWKWHSDAAKDDHFDVACNEWKNLGGALLFIIHRGLTIFLGFS